MSLSFNCFILGDGPDEIFTVEIPHAKTVSILKKMIKEDNPSSLANVDVKKIELWKLRSEKLLSDLFPSDLDNSLIHVVARVDVPPPSSRPPPSAYKYQVPSIDQVGRNRENFCSQRKPEAPSNGGYPRAFLNKHLKSEEYIPCNRPTNKPAALPLSLLHPIFGKYIDDTKDYVPMRDDDQKFFSAFVLAMRQIYETEDGRQKAILKLFNEYDIPIKPTSIGRFTTDGDLSCGDFKFLIAEFKNEVGSKAAEPFFQASLYFLEATRDLAIQHSNSVLPCMIVLIFGPYVAFAGAAWTDRPTVQLLSTTPCYYENTDSDTGRMLMRNLKALRRAIRSLSFYYKEYTAQPSAFWRNPMHPHPTSFTSQDGQENHIRYTQQLKDHNLFFGYMDDDTAICIKFATCYCRDGHEFLALKGFAPKLYAVERLPGGFYMVVMDDISKEYTTLFDLIQKKPDLLSKEKEHTRESFSEDVRQCLLEFHQVGFVHGDIRNTNIMVKRDGFYDGSFLVLDYDSSGRIGQVRYPFDLNTTTVQRPEGAVGEADIKAEHDLNMLDNIWNISW